MQEHVGWHGEPLHKESLLRIPLVRQMMSDPQVSLVERAIDARWDYANLVPAACTGFNPLLKSVFYGRHSRFAAWLHKPAGPTRALNGKDLVVKEVLFAAHDYLHVWACLAITELCPGLGFGTAPITASNIDDHVFCHLVTEAAATIGLDYWYLSTVDLNEVCDLGTTVSGLTISYREQHLSEIRHFRRDFTVQDPRFFEEFCSFYATGQFVGFDQRILRRSPIGLRWLSHELRYGELQRSYARSWFAFLSHEDIAVPEHALAAPLAVDLQWRQQLIKQIALLLWDKVKNGTLHRFSPDHLTTAVWQSPPGRFDHRFLNLNVDRGVDGSQPTHFDYFLSQRAIQHDIRSVDANLLKLLPMLRKKRDQALVNAFFRNARRLPATEEPRNLFFLS